MVSEECVEDELHRAIKTLDAVMDPDRRFVKNKTTFWPDILIEMEERFGWEPAAESSYRPTPRDIDVFLDRLDWIRAANAQADYALLRQRAYGISWREIARRRGRSDQYWRRHYSSVLDRIIEAAGAGQRSPPHEHPFP